MRFYSMQCHRYEYKQLNISHNELETKIKATETDFPRGSFRVDGGTEKRKGK